MKKINLKFEEPQQKRFEELSAIAEDTRTEEQKTELDDLQVNGKKGRYSELYLKDESKLTDEEVEELLTLSEEFKGSPRKEEDTGGHASPKKYAGIYDSLEDLAKGILNSESERKRIERDFPILVPKLEAEYKDSQRKVTRLVQEKKEVRTSYVAPLKDCRLHEVSADEYDAWQKKNPMEAQTWLNQAAALNEEQKKSSQKVFIEHPEFYAMSNGVLEPSEDWKLFDKLASDHPEWINDPKGPELCLEAMKKSKGGDYTPKPKPKEPAPDFSQGKGSGGAPGTGRMSDEEFAKLDDEGQRKVLRENFERKNK